MIWKKIKNYFITPTCRYNVSEGVIIGYKKVRFRHPPTGDGQYAIVTLEIPANAHVIKVYLNESCKVRASKAKVIRTSAYKESLL